MTGNQVPDSGEAIDVLISLGVGENRSLSPVPDMCLLVKAGIVKGVDQVDGMENDFWKYARSSLSVFG